MQIQVKRIYAAADPEDGYRVLVDRIWPRGIAKARSGIHLWLKEVAPTTDLRQWFNHDPSKWVAFKEEYFQELEGKPDIISHLILKAREGRLTLLFSAKDSEFNQATALKEYLTTQYMKSDL